MHEEALARVEALEKALRGAIAYLEALPPHPMTRKQIKALQEHLEAPSPVQEKRSIRAMVGRRFDPTGVEMLRAEFVGSTVYLSTVVGDDTGQKLLEQMRAGRYSVQLTQLDETSPLTSLESSLRMK